jgi:hypothetical protein
MAWGAYASHRPNRTLFLAGSAIFDRLAPMAALQEGDTIVTAAEPVSNLASSQTVAVRAGRDAWGFPVQGSR